jgi:hypothetical protein
MTGCGLRRCDPAVSATADRLLPYCGRDWLARLLWLEQRARVAAREPRPASKVTPDSISWEIASPTDVRSGLRPLGAFRIIGPIVAPMPEFLRKTAVLPRVRIPAPRPGGFGARNGIEPELSNDAAAHFTSRVPYPKGGRASADSKPESPPSTPCFAAPDSYPALPTQPPTTRSRSLRRRASRLASASSCSLGSMIPA